MKLFSIILICLLFSVVRAQDTLRRLPLDIDFQTGLMVTDVVRFSAPEWNRLTPGYQNRDELDTTYKVSETAPGSLETSYVQLQVLRGFQWEPLNKRNITTLYGFSIGGESGVHAHRAVDLRRTYRVDTLTGSTGNPIYVDSLIWNTETKTLENRFLNAGVSLLLQTNRNRRFVFLTGLTITGGVQYRGDLTVYSSKYSWKEHSATDPTIPNPMFDAPSIEETKVAFNTPWAFQVGARLPVEIDFQFGKRFEFLDNWVYGMCFNFGYTYTEIAGYGSRNLFTTLITGVIKYELFD